MGVNVEQFEKECLDEHNRLRGLHGCPPLKINRELCTYAKEWATHLVSSGKMEHRPNPVHGENIFMSKGGQIDGKKPAASWYSEIKDYNFEQAKFGMNTGHFTQLVWKDTTELGVGIEEKDDLRIVVCNYKPPGNVMTKFKDNVPAVKKFSVNVRKFEKECLSEHNRLRAIHDCPPLVLSRELCEYAKKWAKRLITTGRLEHRPNPIHGENILMLKGGQINGKMPVSFWYDEIKDYDFDKAKCSIKTGHFTQVVWKDTTELGVALEERDDLRIVVANYNPHGNVWNQFKINVPPVMHTINGKSINN